MIVTIATCHIQCHSQPVPTRIHKITILTCLTHHTFFSCIQDARGTPSRSHSPSPPTGKWGVHLHVHRLATVRFRFNALHEPEPQAGHHLLAPLTAQLPTMSTTLAVPAIARFDTTPPLKSTMASFARLQPDWVPCQPFTLSMESFIPSKSRRQKTKLCLTVLAPSST